MRRGYPIALSRFEFHGSLKGRFGAFRSSTATSGRAEAQGAQRMEGQEMRTRSGATCTMDAITQVTRSQEKITDKVFEQMWKSRSNRMGQRIRMEIAQSQENQVVLMVLGGQDAPSREQTLPRQLTPGPPVELSRRNQSC
jgi:hypothetical protein